MYVKGVLIMTDSNSDVPESYRCPKCGHKSFRNLCPAYSINMTPAVFDEFLCMECNHIWGRKYL